MIDQKLINGGKKDHDLKAHLSTLQLAIDMIQEEWQKNPDSACRVIDLSVAKLLDIKELLKK